MAKGFDCASALTLAKAKMFVEDGYGFVCRYLAPIGSWKRLSAKEAKEISAAGLWIVSIFEQGADNASKGAAQGKIDGINALKYAREVGQPTGINSYIYPTVDFDASPKHFNAIEAYLKAFAKEVKGYQTGVYAEYEVGVEMLKRNAVTKVWQTYAWSKGRKIANAALYQYQNNITINGVNVDLDVSDGNAGGWQIK